MALTTVKFESDLLALVAKGDQRAFARLFDAYYRKLGDYVFKMTESLEVTEEIVQDVFVKIWLKRETLPTLDNFTYYLFILSKNQTLNHLRKSANDKVRQIEWLKEFENEIDSPDNDVQIEEFRVLLEIAVDKLPPQQKKVYKMSREDRIKHDEIAKQLGLSPETVKKHIKLALKFIKNELSSADDAVIILILTTPLFIF